MSNDDKTNSAKLEEACRELEAVKRDLDAFDPTQGTLTDATKKQAALRDRVELAEKRVARLRYETTEADYRDREKRLKSLEAEMSAIEQQIEKAKLTAETSLRSLLMPEFFESPNAGYNFKVASWAKPVQALYLILEEKKSAHNKLDRVLFNERSERAIMLADLQNKAATRLMKGEGTEEDASIVKFKAWVINVPVIHDDDTNRLSTSRGKSPIGAGMSEDLDRHGLKNIVSGGELFAIIRADSHPLSFCSGGNEVNFSNCIPIKGSKLPGELRNIWERLEAIGATE